MKCSDLAKYGDQRVTTHDIRLISGWFPLYPAVGFRRNIAVFSDFFKFFTLWPLSSDVWPIFRYIQQVFFNTLRKSVRYFIEIRSIFSWYSFIVLLISWYPVYRFPARCHALMAPLPSLGPGVTGYYYPLSFLAVTQPWTNTKAFLSTSGALERYISVFSTWFYCLGCCIAWNDYLLYFFG